MSTTTNTNSPYHQSSPSLTNSPRSFSSHSLFSKYNFDSDSQKDRKKRSSLVDTYESNIKRKMSELSEYSSFKKTCRDSLKSEPGNGILESGDGSDDEDISINYQKSSKVNLDMLKQSKSVKSLRHQQQQQQMEISQQHSPYSECKSSQSYSPLYSANSHHSHHHSQTQPAHITTTTSTTNSSNCNSKHSNSLTSVSSIPANQLRAHVNRADADEITDLEELEQFAKTFKQRRIKLGMYHIECCVLISHS